MRLPSAIKQAEIHHAAAWKAAESGAWVDAISEIDAAIQQSNGAKYWAVKGDFLREMKQFAESEFAIRKALEIKPSADYAWAELGLLFKERELYEEAATFYERSVKLRPDHCVYTLLANVQLAFDPHAALANAERALKLEPGWEEAIAIREAAKRQLEEEEGSTGKKTCQEPFL